MRQMSAWTAILALVLGAAIPTLAQLPFGGSVTALTGATVYVDGKPVENCTVLISGKKIKAVGVGLEVPEGADVVNLAGRVIVPALIDASTELGLAEPASAGRGRNGAERPHFDILDELDPFTGEPFMDALDGGVAYAYLRNGAAAGVGGRGAGILVPAEELFDLDGMRLEGVEALHVRLGRQPGPIARYLEVKALEQQLDAADKYRESWKKYREEKEKYEKELAKQAKTPAKKGDSKDPKAKKPGAVGFDSQAESAAGHDHDHDHDHDQNASAADEVEVATVQLPEPWSVWALGDPEMSPVRIVLRERAEEESHEPAFPETWDLGSPVLSRQPSFIGDGTEPQLAPEPISRQDDPSGVAIFVCAHCGGELEGQAHYHPEPRGFDFWEFALGGEDAPPAKPGAPAKKEDKGPKKPNEPRFDPSMEQLVRVLEGKLTMRVEVHREADIRNLLALLESRPLRVVLEGLTEGWMVADAIAKAEVPVILFGDLVAPEQEGAAGGDGAIVLPAGIPPELIPLFLQSRRRSVAAEPSSGRAVPDLAARLTRAGVPVVIAASRSASEASSALLLAAARAAGQGLNSADAIKAVTTRAAQVLGLEDLGELTKGNRASFVVLDGDPLASSTRLQAIYVDGKTYYKKK